MFESPIKKGMQQEAFYSIFLANTMPVNINGFMHLCNGSGVRSGQ
jgi:hypothetical protein